MRLPTNMIASIGLIGGMSLMTLTPVIAATPNEAPSGSAVTHSPVPSTSNPIRANNDPAPVHSVAILQEALDGGGANLRVDGIWGPATEVALKRYQKQNGLQVTGRLDQATRLMLDPIG